MHLGMIWLFTQLACSPSVDAPSAAPHAADPGAPQANPHTGVDFQRVDACGSCHGPIVEEWKESMHARAHADNDPIFKAMRALRMKKQGEGVAKKCTKCHNPIAPDAPDSELGRQGVACGACHDATSVIAHDSQDGRTVCLSCHGEVKNGHGAPVCTTGVENEEAGSATCASCHLPPDTTDGHPVHRFLGPHRAWYQDDPSMLKAAVKVDLQRVGDTLSVKVVNTTGHAFPSGFPGRFAAIKLTDGTWTSTPDALIFKKVYTTAKGKPTMPPFADKLAVDTRLSPNEARSVEVALPEGTGEVRAELVFRLLPPPAAKALGIQDLPEAQPRVIPLSR